MDLKRKRTVAPKPFKKTKRATEEEKEVASIVAALVATVPDKKNDEWDKEAWREKRTALETEDNRCNAFQVQEDLLDVVRIVSTQFKDDYGNVPNFLFEMWGTYLVPSTLDTLWTPDLDIFWIGKKGFRSVVVGKMTAKQNKLRYAMLSEFEKEGDKLTIAPCGKCITVKISPDIMWLDKD